MAGNVNNDDVKYLQFQSVVDQSFWHKLCQLKLDVDRLEENQRTIWGLYLQPNISSVYVDYTAFNRYCFNVIRFVIRPVFHKI